ncbi:integrase [Streptococcus pneumoniae]|nr:integrase [Streptococcus pneumoniae]
MREVIQELLDSSMSTSAISQGAHMMRHFFTTQSIIAGVPLEQLSQALGHTKVYMTDRYNQVEDELAEATTDLFLSHIR